MGLVYRYDDKLWFVELDGTPALVTPHPYGYLSPNHQMVLYRNKCDTFWNIDWKGEQTDVTTKTLDMPSFCPRWAYDGRYVYYSKPCERFGSESNESYCEWDVWIADIESGERRNLTKTPDRDEDCVIYSAAHPDVLFFYSTPVEMLADGGGAGWLGYLTGMQTDGSQYTVISESGLLSAPAFSPDGQTIAYNAAYDSQYYQLWLHQWGSEPQPLDWEKFGLGKWEVNVSSISWSPEGNRLACWAWGESESGRFEGILLLDLEAETFRVLQPLWHPIYWDGFPPPPEWSPDGQWLSFFGSDESHKKFGIWVISVEGNDVEVLGEFNADQATDSGGRAWSPDSDWLVFTRHKSDPEQGIWLVKVRSWELFKADMPANAEVVKWANTEY